MNNPTELLLFATTLASVALAVLVFSKGPKSEINVSFGLFILSAAVWSFCILMTFLAAGPFAVMFWIRSVYLGAVLMPASFLYFSLVFPRRDKELSRSTLLICLLPALLLIAILPTDLMIHSRTVNPWMGRPVYGLLYPLFSVYLMVYLLWGALNLLRKYFTSRGVEKMQIRYVFWGIIFSFPFGIMTNLLLPLAGVSDLNRIGPVFTLFFLGFTSYSIIKYRLMSIEIAVKKGVVFTVTVTLLSALYISFVLLTETVLTGLLGYRSVAGIVITAFIIVLTIQPLYSFIRSTVDRVFFKGIYSYHEKMKRSGKTFSSLLKLDQLADLFLETLAGEMGVSSVSVLMADKKKRVFSPVQVDPSKKFSVRYKKIDLPKDGPVASWLRINRQVLVRSEAEAKARASKGKNIEPELLEEIKKAEGQVFVPIIVQDEIFVIIVLGEKDTGEMYTVEDIMLLSSMAKQTALSVENINLYEEILSMKEYSDEVLRNMTNGVVSVAAFGEVVIFNSAAAAMFRKDSSTAKGKDYRDVFSDVPLVQEMIEQGLKGAMVSDFEEQMVFVPGEEKTLSITTSAIADHKSGKKGLLMVINDLTQVRRLERMVRQADKLAALGTMAAGMAHEIKNPLASIKVLSQLIGKKYSDSEFRKRFLDIMPVEIGRIDRIVEGMLGYVRTSRLNIEEADVNTLIEEAVAFFSDSIGKNRVCVEFNKQDIPRINIDVQQIFQVLLNLIQNALHAMPRGGVLKIGAKRASDSPLIGESVEIKISDTGCGISKADLPRIFDPFFTLRYGGTGLGLTIVHGIIESHKGIIDVDSQEGKGTVFTVILPVKAAFEKEEAKK